MKKMAVIFNTNQLGGAERSLIEQLAMMDQTWDYHIFYPGLGLSDQKIRELLLSKGFSKIKTFPYPNVIYQLSRQSSGSILSLVFGFPLLIIAILKWAKIFNGFDTFYLNGLKASLPILSWSFFANREQTIFWHFRDFPSGNTLPLIQKLIKPQQKLRLIANSEAVLRDLQTYFPDHHILCLYNLSGKVASRVAPVRIKKIGVVSMMAPWKGLHTVMLMSSLYEKELKALGVEKISIYGKSIYQTQGDHSNYFEQLKKLKTKLKNSLIVLEGEKSPEEIFSEIDLLIHPSLSPEPFGRIILEAFKSHVPVLSTSLGGSRELIDGGKFGLEFLSYDYDGLFNHIQRFCVHTEEITPLTSRAYSRALEIESEIGSKLKGLLIK